MPETIAVAFRLRYTRSESPACEIPTTRVTCVWWQLQKWKKQRVDHRPEISKLLTKESKPAGGPGGGIVVEQDANPP